MHNPQCQPVIVSRLLWAVGAVRLEVAILPTYPALSAVIVVAVRLAFPAFCICYWFRSSVLGPPWSPGQRYFSLAELSLAPGDLISVSGSLTARKCGRTCALFSTS